MKMNKVVLVTGGAQRIGAEICRCFHHDGYNILLHYNQSETAAKSLQSKLCEKRKDSVRLLQLDLVANKAWSPLLDFCHDQWGRLDVLINNASSFYPTPIGKVTEQHWDDILGSNLKSPYFLSQALAPALREVAGCIVNIIDIHGDRPLKNYSVYSIAKAGLAMLTRSLAKELAPEVRVNGISPGAILWPEDQARISEQTRSTIIRQIPLKRQGAPEDVGRTACFLAHSAPYINGQILAVDGGRSLS
ncbi:MAG: pteridine reductase [Gammaproteobacteria bacterium]|nr:pteridine reductase [Gammaproteobacteria bacterium]